MQVEQMTMTAGYMPGQKEIDRHLEKVRRYIRAYTAHTLGGTPVGEVLDDAVSSCGKMIRPQLVLLAGQFGPDRDAVGDRLHQLAAIVEMTHLSSLIHDDIIDDAPERRGKPSVQSKYGKDAAVYAGDFLMSRISYHTARENMNRAAQVLGLTVEEMCIGEIGQARCRYREDVSVQEYLHNIHGKTAALFMAACRIGAEESGCEEETVGLLERFGECVGILFQLRDDLLDFISSQAEEGKQVHKDFRDGIYTMPLLCALESEEGRQALLPIMRANARGELTDGQVAEMERMVVELGGVDAARAKIRICCEEARAYMRRLPENRAVKVMERLLRKLEV